MINALLIIAIIILASTCFWLLLMIMKYKNDIAELEDKIRELQGVEVWW